MKHEASSRFERVSFQARLEIDAFLAVDHSLGDYEEIIMKYKDIAYEIPIVMDHTTMIGMYDMHRSALIQAMVEEAHKLRDDVLDKLNHVYQTNCRLIGEEYQQIAEKLLTVPDNTAELMKLIAYATEVETKTLTAMEERLMQEVMVYILFIIDHIDFTAVELKQNNQTFQWYLKMHKILDENRGLVEIKMEEFKKTLQTRIKKFVEDLNFYKRKVDELEFNGDVNELAKYTTTATSLDNRLVAAMQRIEEFNEEEEAYGWELSQYPLRKQVHDKLRPYKQLYDNSTDFVTKQNTWLNSQIGSHDPEDIEVDVTTLFRNVYKLEKIFSEKPETKNLAVAVRQKIEDFKENMPVIQTLGNPGMKDRHWEKISEIVGFPIIVSENLTLAKIIDYNLVDYISKFETISESATKENNLEKALSKMVADWKDLEFVANPYRDTGTYILSSVDDIQVLLDDHIVKTQTMKNSPYIKPFEEQIL